MARLGCKCGELMWNGLTPNDIQIYAYTDRQMDAILNEDEINTIELFGKRNYEVWVCPACKRLYVFGEDRMSAQFVYKLEEE